MLLKVRGSLVHFSSSFVVLSSLLSYTQLSDTIYGNGRCINTKKVNNKFRAEFRVYTHIAQFCNLAYLLFLLLPFHFKFVKHVLLKFLLFMRRSVYSCGHATSVSSAVDKYSSDLSPNQNIHA